MFGNLVPVPHGIAAIFLSLTFLSSPEISLAQQVAIGGYALPLGLLLPQGIAVGPDNALWFTSWADGTIGRITTAGAITQYPLPTALCYPLGITAGPDGALWFAETGGPVAGSKIGRITTAGAVTEYPLPYGSDAYDIATGPDGALWFTEYVNNKIGRIATTGALTEYPLPPGTQFPSSYPAGIVSGPDGALWFGQESG
jgi:virginiamycin B lyase